MNDNLCCCSPLIVPVQTFVTAKYVTCKYELLPGSVAVWSSNNVTPSPIMIKFVCTQQVYASADDELGSSVVNMFHGLKDKMDEGVEVEEKKKNLHKPQTTSLLPPRRVLCLIYLVCCFHYV